jgi:hypothetical protein
MMFLQFQRSFKKVVLNREESSSHNKDLKTRKTIMMDNNGKIEALEREDEEEEEVYAAAQTDKDGDMELKVMKQSNKK